MITKEQFESYEAVRELGVTNMLAVNTVCELSGLTREQVFEIMKNYSALKSEMGK